MIKTKSELLQRLLLEMYNADIKYKCNDNMVFNDGDINSPIMFIGEAPGETEVKQGRPFVGKSGKLLQEMLDAAGLTRDIIYITNTVIWRPPLNRTPLPNEIEMMKPYLLQHIQIINPKIIILIGGIATRCFTNKSIAISKIRGQWAMIDGYKTMSIFHPSYLYRSPMHKEETWLDILHIREEVLNYMNLKSGKLII